MRKKVFRPLTVGAVAVAALVATADPVDAMAPSMVVLGEFGDADSCNAAAASNNQVGAEMGLPGRFSCLLFRGQYWGVYFDV